MPNTMPNTGEPETQASGLDQSHGQYKCGICGYIYSPAKGDKKHGIPEGMPFEELPESWACPLCGKGKVRFSPVR